MIQNSRIKELTLYFFILVPFLPNFIPNTYTAPYAVMISTAFVLLMKRKVLPRELFILFILFLLSLILLSNGLNFNTLRILIGYFSIFIISFGTYFICKLNNRVNEKLIYIFFLIWFFIGLIQYFINPDFMKLFVVHSRSTHDRGVGGLAPEPSYYASVMLFFIIISYITNYKFKITFFLGVLSIIFASASATGVFVLIGFFLIYFFIFSLNIKTFKIFIIFGIFLFIFYLNFDFFSGTRLHKIIYKFTIDPVHIFVHDESANARIWHIIGSFKGAYDNYLLPNPINNFYQRTLFLMQDYTDYVHPYTIKTLNNKPMSGTGQMFFNLGIISLLYFYVLLELSYKYFNSKTKALFITSGLFLFMTTAIPLTFPMFGFIYGILAYKAYNESYEDLSSIRKS